MTPPTIPLRDGPIVLEEVALWLIEASFRLHFFLKGPYLYVEPRKDITADDRQFITDHRFELIYCLDYVDRICQETA